MDNKHNTRESEIETKFIEQLLKQSYIYRGDIKDRYDLEENFRNHFNNLNRVNLSDKEFANLKASIIKDNIFDVSKILRAENYMEREDGTPLFYSLVNKKDWCKNEFEVVNQLRINTENSYHRYDVIILINGLPIVQIELKEYATNPKRAMEQIIKYKNDIGNGYTNSLLCFVQLFIVSNGNNTFYFANNNNEYFTFNADERFLPVYRYADKDNVKITKLNQFTEKFLDKCTLAELISKYMVLVETEKRILVMRPYQIEAVKAILSCIEEKRGNGYIWHTTGSGKTLTSFKASTLLKADKSIDKCLFVVDRKDLDNQTRDEFNKFQENCVEENTNTEKLVNRLLSDDIRDKIIVTTIQKLGIAIDADSKQNKKKVIRGLETFNMRLQPIKDKKFVIIFDECHRSQFGDYHKGIKKFFPNSQLFGFTGTPIFVENATGLYVNQDNEQLEKTTESIFEKELHKYTITDAIEDDNVLKFHVDYYDKTGRDDNIKPTAKAVKLKIVDVILNKHNGLTHDKRFNALFATASINDAIEYYNIFKEKISENETYSNMNIACIFSPPAEGNKDIKQMQEDLEQERKDNLENQSEKKAALTEIINDYNKKYSTNFDLDKFDEYYTNIQKRIKDQQYPNEEYSHDNKIDITIVVDMLLTGFDSKYLNTLYVDKNLKYHGLIQAFSRTNRILNSTKPHGNIVDFRNQHFEVDKAVVLFSGLKKDDVEGSKRIWLTKTYTEVKAELEKSVENLKDFMEAQGLEFEPSQVCNIKGDISRVDFINKFREVQRLLVKIDQYTEIPEEERQEIENLIPEDKLKGFRGEYLELAQQLKKKQDKQEESGEKSAGDDKVNNADFDFVLFASAIIDYDYIMSLISKYTFGEKIINEVMTKEQLILFLKSYSNFMDEQEDIIEFVETLEVGIGLSEEEIKKAYKQFKETKRNNALINLAKEFNINEKELIRIANDTIRQMSFSGDMLDGLFSDRLNWKERAKLEEKLMAKLIPILNKMAEGHTIRGLDAYESY